MNELQRLKQLLHLIANPIEGVPQVDVLEQMQLRMLGDIQLKGLSERRGFSIPPAMLPRRMHRPH